MLKAEEEKARDRALTEKLENLTLEQAVTLEKERKACAKAAAIDRLETSAAVAQEAMLLTDASTYNDRSIQEIDRHILTAHLDLSKIVGDDYSQERAMNTQALSH